MPASDGPSPFFPESVEWHPPQCEAKSAAFGGAAAAGIAAKDEIVRDKTATGSFMLRGPV